MIPLGVVCVGLFVAFSQRPPTLDRARLDAARELWTRTQVPDYHIEIVVQGRQPATYAVDVEKGEAVKALRNQNPLTQPRTFGTWSVDGMFRTIESDILSFESQLDVSKSSGKLPTLMLRAEFDPQYGYPKRYFRADWQRNLETNWVVSRFERTESP